MQTRDPLPVSVRPAVAEDCDTIAAFNVRLAAESESVRLDEPTVRCGVAAVLADSARGRYFLAEVECRIAGQTMITYEWSDWRNGWFWWIQSVYVDPAYRRRGVFRSLHRHIAREARKQAEVCGLRLYVISDNRPALDTYRGLGLAPSGHVLYETDWSGSGHVPGEPTGR
jgi:GNAT superfamily N-acetyltransferase